jgi:hypothetical protein
MNNVLVSLVSDHTIPNVLFISEMRRERKDIRLYLFISTDSMEKKGKTNSIIQGSHPSSSEVKTEVIKVIEDSTEDINSKLEDFAKEKLGDGDNLIVNLTGGTKIMSIGVYNFFKELKSTIYYLPIGKNIYKQIFPSLKQREHKLNFRISLKDYLISYGIDIKSRDINRTLKDKKYTEHLFRKFTNNEIDMEIIDDLRTLRNKKQIPLEVEKSSFLNKIAFRTEEEGVLNKKEIKYLTGGWFEEYGYNLVREHIQLRYDKIGLDVQISHAGTQNEFDVMFVHENILYVIECKTALKDGKRSLLNDTLYKLSALKRDFGLIVNGYLFTLDKNLRDREGNITRDYQNRAALLGVRLVDSAILDDERELNKIVDRIRGDRRDV